MTLYFINRFFIKPYISIPVLSYLSKCHINDFFGGIVFCAYYNIIMLLAEKKPIEKFSEVFVVILIVGIIWEFIFPIFLSYSTSDIFDVIAYIFGGTIYYFIKR